MKNIGQYIRFSGIKESNTVNVLAVSFNVVLFSNVGAWLTQLVRSLLSSKKITVSDYQLFQDLNFCVTFFSTKADSACHPYKVDK